MKSPKRREIISLVFTSLCITKSLLIRISELMIIFIFFSDHKTGTFHLQISTTFSITTMIS